MEPLGYMRPPLIVTAKVDPDLDGTCCAVAYAEFLRGCGTPAVAVLAGRPDAEARHVLALVGCSIPATPPRDYAGVVLVDMSALPGLPPFVDPGAVLEVIDHRMHGDPSTYFPMASIRIEEVGAAATLVYERIAAAGLMPSASSAILLQAGIQSNTQCLRGSVTSERDVAAATALQRAHPLPAGMLAAQFEARRAEIQSDLGAAIRRETKTFDHPDGAFTLAQLECPGALELAGDLEASGPAGRALINLVDPMRSVSALVALDPDVRAWVERCTQLTFHGAIARAQPALLRKQLVARMADCRRPD